MMINPLASALSPDVAATSRTAATSNNSATQTPTQTANSAEQTFLSLLVTELQSQDPTSPMDPIQMVGQMLNMNQLNELISINQTLQTAFGMSGTSAQPSSSAIPSLTGAN
ncbi:MAG: flagellar hook capping FlgD N-terminal domain-containing protein [Terriglobales bacterium]